MLYVVMEVLCINRGPEPSAPRWHPWSLQLRLGSRSLSGPVREAWKTQCSLVLGLRLLVAHPSPGGAQTCSLGPSAHSPCPLSPAPWTCAVLWSPHKPPEGSLLPGGASTGVGLRFALQGCAGGQGGSESAPQSLVGAFGGRDTWGKQADGEGLTLDPQDAASAAARVVDSAQPLRPSSQPSPHGLVCALCTAVLTDSVIMGGSLGGRGDRVTYPALKTWCPCSVSLGSA